MGVNFITDQMKAALKILEKEYNGGNIKEDNWDNLFDSRGYILLKRREKEMGNNLKESIFKDFLSDYHQIANYPGYKKSLNTLKRINLRKVINQTRVYLPDKADINAEVIPLIKNKNNSFVHKFNDNMYIFLNLEPNILKERLLNKLVHEFHHIGFDDIYNPKEYKYLSRSAQQIIKWSNAFGEGLAMLAAAGGPDFHPNKYDKELKTKWDKNIKKFNKDFRKIQKFFMDILNKKIKSNKEIYDRGFELMVNNGGQGSWYTVGWQIAVVIEKISSKWNLLNCMEDLTKIFILYNNSVFEYNEIFNKNLLKWDQEIIHALQ